MKIACNLWIKLKLIKDLLHSVVAWTEHMEGYVDEKQYWFFESKAKKKGVLATLLHPQQKHTSKVNNINYQNVQSTPPSTI